jgi:hypothetical protein
MKKSIIFLVLCLVVGACIKDDKMKEPDGKWNGYFSYLKLGEVVHTLWAGKHINVGTVTFGINEDAYFYVTYHCTSPGWQISETHLYVGDKAGMPVNKPGSPKVGHFPYSGQHDPMVIEFTYTIPLEDLPPAENPGFVVACHCVVHGPNGQIETAWAEGEHTFRDKGWGWYSSYYYNQTQDSSNIIYGVQSSLDSLMVYMIDVSSDTAMQILVEEVGGISGKFDAAAYDETSDMYFFANYNTGELWINPLGDESDSFLSGYLAGTPASGTFYDQSYYYVDEQVNSVNKVDFNDDWTISSITEISSIPYIIVVSDIAMSPSGDVMYIVGTTSDGLTELISWDVIDDTYVTTPVALNNSTQIAYGPDGKLYALSGIIQGTGVPTYQLTGGADSVAAISIGTITVDEPFSDITKGRSW